MKLERSGVRSAVELPLSYLRRSTLVAVALGAAVTSPALGVDVSGSYRGLTGVIDAAGLESQEEDQTFRLVLTQSLTPWLSVFGSFRSSNFRTSFDTLPTFERTTEQPEFGLTYGRTGLNARVSFSDRAIRTTDDSQDLDIRTLLANVDWQPSRGPRYGFRLVDSTSTADAVLFGRDTRSRNLNFRTDYARATWNARYSFDLARVDNDTADFKLEQSRHELRAGYLEDLWGDRWSFAVDARYADVVQTQDAPSGATASLPVPVAQGLFAVDSTPSLGELEQAPQLIDGDTTTPAASGIEIGGANTFRNIGVDLGINRPISGLEITVDIPSGPVVWEVWESPDNSSWFRVSSATSSFDAGFLRYTIRFAETTNRFFKAVNLTVNPVQDVSVTEVRALLTTAQLARSEGGSSEYWVNLLTSLRPTDKFELSVGANLRRDQDLVATELRRSYDERGLTAQLRTDFTDELELRLSYRVTELDESSGPVRERREEVATAALDWRPLETINLLLTAEQRDETDGGRPLSSTDSLILRGVTEIFPDLVVRSTLGYSDTSNPFFGFSQETRYIVEAIEARPTDRWLLAGTFARYQFDSVGRVVVRSRTSAQVRATWFATPFLSLHGERTQTEDDFGDTATQRAGVQWSPGQRLSLSTSYFETDSSIGSGTANFAFDGSYRLNRWIQLWMALNQAETSLATVESTTTEALRLGVNAVF